jgi:class 3 adenylate cyclase
LHLAVWDQRAGDGPGGTADTIGRWRDQGHEVTIIDLEELIRPYSLPKAKHTPAKPVIRIPTHGIIRGSDLVAIFFADAKGFSKLPEPELPGFVEHFLGLIARQIDALPQSEQPLKRNTWGDAVYLVLPDVCTAGRVALDIADALRHTRWSDYGLPDELTMRIGLHAGPNYRLQYPVTKRDRFVGSHISLAARIEPIVAPGRVYASEAFAVLAAEAGTTDFGCRYLGMKALPKNAGTLPVFAVERGQDHRQW